MSSLKLASDTLKVTPEAGDIEYNGEFFGTDSAGSRAQLGRMRLEVAKTATGTAVDFTDAPPWAVKATVMFSGVSTSGTSAKLIQLGDSGGIENTGYVGSASWGGAAFTSALLSSGILLSGGGSDTAAAVIQGNVIITNIDSNTWTFSGTGSFSNVAASLFVSGAKSLSALLTQIRITTVNGTDTFDAGTINILYEG